MINKDSVTLSYKQLGMIALVILNILIVGPGGWVLKTVWSDTKNFQTEVRKKFETFSSELATYKVDVTSGFVPQQTFAAYREQMEERIRYLDSKVGD